MERKSISLPSLVKDEEYKYASFTYLPPEISNNHNFERTRQRKRQNFSIMPCCHPEEDETNQRLRQEALEICQQILKEAYQDLFREVYAEYLGALPGFFEVNTSNEDELGMIPFAVVEPGFHVCDRAALTRYVLNFLQKHGFDCAVSLNASDCPDLKSIFSSIRHQLTGKRKHEFDAAAGFFDELVELLSLSSKQESQGIKHQNTENAGISEQEQSGGCLSPEQNELATMVCNNSSVKQPNTKFSRLVLVLGNPESFDLELLNRFLDLLADMKGQRPWLPVVVVCVTHPMCGVPAYLSRRVKSRLLTRSFSLPGAAEFLRDLVDRIFFGPKKLPIMVGPKVYKTMSHFFESSHYSVKTFLRQMEFSLVEHFSRPASYLCMLGNERYKEKYKYDDEGLSQALHSCAKPYLHSSDFDADYFPSLKKERMHEPKKCNEGQSKKRRLSSDVIGKVEETMQWQRDNLAHFCAAALCLRESLKTCLLSEDLKKYNWMVVLRHLLAMNSALVPVIEKIFAGLRQIPLKEVLYLLKKWEMILKKQSENSSANYFDSLLKLVSQIHLLLLEAPQLEKGSSKTINDGLVGEMQLLLLEVLTTSKDKSWLSGPFNEIWWFDDASALEDALGAQMRSSVVRALDNPVHYLRCKCCSINRTSQHMQDTCIAYQLYESQGQRIDIQQWFEEFAECMLGCNESNEAQRKQIKVDSQKGKMLWARFLHAIHELSFLGFTTRDAKKTMPRLIYAYTMSGKS